MTTVNLLFLFILCVGVRAAVYEVFAAPRAAGGVTSVCGTISSPCGNGTSIMNAIDTINLNANDTVIISFTGVASSNYTNASNTVDFCGAFYTKTAALVLRATQGNVYITGSCRGVRQRNWGFMSLANFNISISGVNFVGISNDFIYFQVSSSKVGLIIDRCNFFDISMYNKVYYVDYNFISAQNSNVTLSNCFFQRIVGKMLNLNGNSRVIWAGSVKKIK
jgi:hypothetical protein